MYRVLIVDDSAFMREILRGIIESQTDIEVVGEADSGADGFKKFKELKPDLVTLDIVMENENGIEALQKMIEFDSNANIIMVSSVGQEKYIRKCLEIGAKAFITKPFTEDHVLTALRALLP